MQKATITQIITEEAPAAVAAYSQGLIVQRGNGKDVITSGQAGFDPQTGKLVFGGIKEQVERVLQNIDAILQAGGVERGKRGTIISTTVVLSDVSHFADFNAIYEKWIGVQSPLPTRFTSVGGTPIKDALVVVSCTAFIEEEE